MHPGHYAHLVSHAKSLALRTLPKVFVNFRDLCLPYVTGLSNPLVQLSHESCLKQGDLDTYFELLSLSKKMLRSFGIGALSGISALAF